MDDQTPEHFSVTVPSRVERYVKRPIRRWGYPLLTALRQPSLERRYGSNMTFHVDRWLWGQRGNDYEAHRRRLNHLMPLRDKDILIVGCGTGNDVPSWLPYGPRRITGTDYFDYSRAWSMIQTCHPSAPLRFVRDDLLQPQALPPGSVDVIGSDAVFEHLSNLRVAAQSMHRILRKNGLLYATWGALWYCWGGDHASGYDSLAGGYNHLLLEKGAYQAYLDAMGPYENRPEDGRLWAKNGLFSYLRPNEYMEQIQAAGFSPVYCSVILEPRAVQFLRAFPEQALRLRQLVREDHDLIVAGMSAVWRKF